MAAFGSVWFTNSVWSVKCSNVKAKYYALECSEINVSQKKKKNTLSTTGTWKLYLSTVTR